MSYLLACSRYSRLTRRIPIRSGTLVHASSSRVNISTRSVRSYYGSVFRTIKEPPLKCVTKFSNHSLPLIHSSYLPSLLWNTFRNNSWKKGSKYWSNWWGKFVKSVNRRCWLCAGAIFLWDRERITNQEVSKSLSNYERRVSKKLFSVVSATDTKLSDTEAEQKNNITNNSPHNKDSVTSDESSCNNNDNSSTQINNISDNNELTKPPPVSEPVTTPTVNTESDEHKPTNKENSNKSKRPKRKSNPNSPSNHGTSKLKRNQRQRSRPNNLKKPSKQSEEKETSNDSNIEQNNKIEQVKENNSIEEMSPPADILKRETEDVNVITGIDDTCVDQHNEDPMKGWELMSVQDNCTVYSKPYGNSGLFQYKVIGFYSDITAHDFLDVQITDDDRMSWDSYCLSLKTVDRDSSTGSEVIHWVLKFPFPMSDRDYVFVRRYWISPNDDAIVIINRAVDHPSVPETRKYVRVKSYFSEMTIKPTTFIDEIGFHYELTYFDDPGTLIPSSAVSWVSKSAMPDYLNKIYKATVRRQSVLNEHKHVVA